jgi:hypothetical protein
MKSSIAAVLLLLSIVAADTALAQGGLGNGPPRLTSVVFVAQGSTPAKPHTLRSLFVPTSPLASLPK